MIAINKFNFFIFGTGRLAHSFVYSLQNAGFYISGVYDRNLNNAKEFAEKFNIKFYTSDLYNIVVPKNSLIFLAISDSSLVDFSIIIKKELDLSNKPFFIHFSAALSSDILSQIYNDSNFIGSMHIMQTFPDKNIYSLENCYCAIETDDNDLRNLLSILAEKLSLKIKYINKRDKILYHLIGVFASNFLVANLFYTKYLAEKINISEKELMDIILPIIDTTLQNSKNNGILNSLSGPVIRNDYLTIEKHRQALQSLNNNLLLDYYNVVLKIQEEIKKIL
jgi:predicted short-subunit dehydrogenase-like oxidoreductase (DUF2520 family)